MKKLLSFLFAFVLALTCLTSALACEGCGLDSWEEVPTYEELQLEALRRISEDPNGIAGKRAVVVHVGNIRANANKYSTIVGASCIDDEHQILSYQIVDGGVWLQIQYGLGTAWISASLVEISGADTAQGSNSLYIGRTCKIKVSSGKARMSPGVNAPTIDYVHRGEKYYIINCQAASDGTLWFQIRTNDATCWISSGLAEVY